jgi:hypothetical protein
MKTTVRRHIVQRARTEADVRLVQTTAFGGVASIRQFRRRHASDEWGAKGGMTRLEAED